MHYHFVRANQHLRLNYLEHRVAREDRRVGRPREAKDVHLSPSFERDGAARLIENDLVGERELGLLAYEQEVDCLDPIL